MGRTTETNYAVVGVTMATVYVAEEIYIYIIILIDVGKQSLFSVNGT